MVRQRESGTAGDQPFWAQRGWLMSAGFLVVVAFAGVVTALVGLTGGDGSEAPVVTAGGALAAGVPAGRTRPEGCATEDGDQEPPQQPPADVTWKPLNGADVPVSSSAGPLREEGPLLWCFAHTPMGAVMAANVIPRHMSGPDWRTAVALQIEPGLQRDLFESARASIESDGTVYTAASLAGFQVMSYSPEAATIRLLIKQSAALYGVTDVTVVWSGGDWKLQAQNGGELYTRVTAVTANAGFVMWGV